MLMPKGRPASSKKSFSNIKRPRSQINSRHPSPNLLGKREQPIFDPLEPLGSKVVHLKLAAKAF
jgi:hypothetical protein